jgi:hypothetical protein
VQVVANLYRVTVIRRPPPASTLVPVTAALADAWQAALAEIDSAAMQNLRDGLATAGDFIEVLAFGPRGRSGTLKANVDPAVILLPEFLAAVQREWKTSDNLVLFLPAASNVTFVEQHNVPLLDLLVPQWKRVLGANPNPLYQQLLLRDAERLSPFAHEPTTKPAATRPAATKPAPYFVH